MNGVDRVTFVGHDASRTGAPIVLLSFLRWIRANHAADVELVLQRGGPLLEGYRSIVPTRLLDGRVRSASTGLVQALNSIDSPLVGPASQLDRAVVRSRAGRRSPQVVVANTVAALAAAAAIRPPEARLVCHVHELDHVVERALPGGDRGAELLRAVDHFVAVGDAVATMLVERLGVRAAEVTVVEPFIDERTPTRDDIAEARANLVGSDPRSIVLSVGATSHRKGSDRFVDLLGELASDAVVGVWLGADPATVVHREMRDDIERSGVGGSVRLCPPVAAPSAAIAAADVVVSTSREDPFPLGLLEAAAAGVPTVVFDAGGFSGLLRRSGCGDRVIAQGDTLHMAAKVRDLLVGSAAERERTRSLQHQIRTTRLTEHVAPELWDTVAP